MYVVHVEMFKGNSPPKKVWQPNLRSRSYHNSRFLFFLLTTCSFKACQIITFWLIWRRVPSADGTAHLPTFCPICRRAGRQTGWPIWEHFVQYADWTKCRQIGQNVGGWDVPSADVPCADWAKCSQMGPSADGTAHLPTFCPVCWWARRQKGWHVGRLGKMLADGTSHCSDLRTTYMLYVRIPLIVRCRTLPVHISYTTPTRSSFYAYK